MVAKTFIVAMDIEVEADNVQEARGIAEDIARSMYRANIYVEDHTITDIMESD